MSAETLQPIVVASYEEARANLRIFHEAIDKGDTTLAARALGGAAGAICRGFSAVLEDAEFWGEVANLINPRNTPSQAIQAVLSSLEAASEEEGNVLIKGGYSSESVGILLGDFDLTLGVFCDFPAGNTLELVRERVKRAKQVICDLSTRPVEIVKSGGFWGRGFRTVVTCLKVLGGVGTIVSDVASVTVTAAAGAALTPLALGIAVASVGSGVATIGGVGEEIFGGVYRK